MEAKGYLVDPVPAPDLHIPKSSNTVTVRMIDRYIYIFPTQTLSYQEHYSPHEHHN